MIDETRFPGRQGRLLFAYLVAEQGRPVPRDELADALSTSVVLDRTVRAPVGLLEQNRAGGSG